MSQTETNAQSATPKGFKDVSAIPARQVFKAGENSFAAALDHLRKILATEGAGDLPTVIAGLNGETGEIDQSIYAGNDIYVIRLMNKGAGVRALVMQPAPTIENFLASPEASSWVADLMETQIAHKMVRSLRAKADAPNADITQEAIVAIPRSIADYVATMRLGGAVKLWNEHAKGIIDQIGSKVPAFAALRLTKDFFRRAIESKEFAQSVFAQFEERGYFVAGAQALINVGKKEGSDTSLIEGWLANRDTVKLADVEASELVDISADDLFDEDE